MDKKYDIAVIGGGPGGYVAAIRAAQLGAKVALIEKDKVGGTCLNRGCIPTKAILACTNFYQKMQKADKYGVTAENISIDLKKVIDRKNTIIDKIVKSLESLIKKNGIEIFYGDGKLIEPGKIEIRGSNAQLSTLYSLNTILATGSSPASIPGITFDGNKFLSSDDILNLTEVPKKLDIVGGGVIGIHFAVIFSALGTEVTIYEAMPDILPGVDEEVVALTKRILARKKVSIKAGIKFYPNDSCGKTLICVGRTPNTPGLKVNEKMETNIPGVYAAGDAVSTRMFAHVAYEQGEIAAENAMGGNRKFSYEFVPYGIYTDPEIAAVGLNEKQAGEKLGDIKVGKFPFAALGISAAMGEIEGFIKVISDKSGTILGVHIIGPEATTLIGSAVIAMRSGISVEKLGEAFQSHPSYTEGLQEASLAALKRSIHNLN